jgi:hypothetical protein
MNFSLSLNLTISWKAEGKCEKDLFLIQSDRPQNKKPVEHSKNFLRIWIDAASKFPSIFIPKKKYEKFLQSENNLRIFSHVFAKRYKNLENFAHYHSHVSCFIAFMYIMVIEMGMVRGWWCWGILLMCTDNWGVETV